MAGPPVLVGGEQRRRGPKQGGQTDRRRAVTADNATAQDQCHPRKLFIGGLAHKTSTQQLRDYFARYGSIVDAVVLRWPDGRSRGFGYVTFQDAAPASAALRTAHEVDGRQVDVKRAVPGTNKLFVGGLPQNTAATELREHFETFGVVSDAVVMIDPATGRSRGFGFVCFLPGQEGAAAVTSALEQYQLHRIRGKWIEVKSAAPPHKLANKDSEVGTPPGLCDTPSSSDWGSAELAAIAMPDLQLPMAPLQNQRESELQKPKSVYEPKKVAMRVTTTATMEAALAAMGSPPGLGAATRSKAPWRPSADAAPWPGCLSLSSALGGQSDPKLPGRIPSVPSYIAAPGPPGFTDTWSTCDSALSKGSLSDSLAKSLEQLLRQQSSRMEADKFEPLSVDVPLKQNLQPECVSPSKVFCHGG